MTSRHHKSAAEPKPLCPICVNLCLELCTFQCGHSSCLECLQKSEAPEIFYLSGTEYRCPKCGVTGQPIIQPTSADKLHREAHKAEEIKPNGVKDETNAVSISGEVSDSADLIPLTPVMTKLHANVAQVSDLLIKAKERKNAVKASNSTLRAEVRVVLSEMVELLKSYSTTGMDLLDSQLRYSEEIMETKIRNLSDLHKQLKETEVQVSSLMKRCDVSDSITEVQSRAACLSAQSEKIDKDNTDQVNSTMNPLGLEMKRLNNELRVKLGAAQRQLQNILNPSEVTFDPETLHPNLVLSEDLKTVSFSAVKQPYNSVPQRFTNLFQTLSSQSFSKGEHSWILEAEGCPWVMGLCYEGLPRSGTGSGLESSSGAWCLMWFNNVLKAYEGGIETHLLRTPFLQKLEICLSFSCNTVAFYSISKVSGAKTHICTFNVTFTEPVYLAVRMISGDPGAQITLCE